MLARMCGIAGVLRIHPAGAPPPPPDAAIPEAWLDILDNSIKHRGPDGQGRFRDRAIRPDGTVVDVALVHRRLAIIDPATGHQPMVWSADRGLWPRDAVNQHARNAGAGWDAQSTVTGTSSDELIAVAFNGCIYNHRELRKELQAAGHRFMTDHSDTEVLVHGWREWGLGRTLENESLPLRDGGLFSRLHDMFAVAVWDRATATLTLARDRFGQKPLYYAPMSANAFAFASCIPGLLLLVKHTGALLRSDAEELLHWIRYGCGLNPPVQPVHGIPVSATATMNGTSVHVEWYEMPEFFGDFFVDPWGGVGWPRGRTLSASEVEAALMSAVTERLQADVPVGCFLSGGIDSSLVAAFAAKGADSLRSFCVRIPGSGDESRHAADVANLLGIAHATLDCDPRPSADLVHLVSQTGLPFGDSSLLPTHWVSRATRQEVPVALSGDGGDEVFAGYERYRAARMLQFARLPLALIPSSPGPNPRSTRSMLHRLTDAARHDTYRDLVSIFPESILKRLVPTARVRATRGDGWGRFPVTGVASAIDFDLTRYLPDDLLRKTDSASMAVALEVRCPFLAPQVAGPGTRATIQSLMPGGQRKGLLRQVARKYLPAEIVDRPKQGFAIPIGEWFRSDYGGMKTLLMDHLNSAEPWGPPSLGINLNMKFIRQMLDEHLGTGMSGRVTRDHSQRLYMLLVLSIWAKWLGGLH